MQGLLENKRIGEATKKAQMEESSLEITHRKRKLNREEIWESAWNEKQIMCTYIT